MAESYVRHFRAPWSASLIVVSLLGTLVLVGGAAVAARETHGAVAALALVLLIGAALFTVRGYTILDHAVLVHRLLWATRLPRAGLQAAVLDPQAMRWSLRLFGNGGLYSFTGLYRNFRLGSYRAFVTDPHRAVVLRYVDRTVVVSPESPEEFIRELLPLR